MKSVKRIIAIMLSIVLIAGTVPLFTLAETPQEISNVPMNMDNVPRDQFAKAVLTPENIAKLNEGAAAPTQANLVLDVLGSIGGDMRCWAVCGMMDSLFGDSGQEESDFLTATAAKQMQNEILNAIGSVANLEDLESILKRINVFIDAANEGREIIAATLATLKEYEDESNPKAPADPETVASRLKVMSNEELVKNANIDSIFNHLNSAVMKSYNITFNHAPTLMDLFDVYLASMRYTFPWEINGVESMKAYYNAIAREYALIAFVDVLSLDARYQLAETEEMKKLYKNARIEVIKDIEAVSKRLYFVNNYYINEHDYHWFWAPSCSVKIPKRDSYAVELPQDTNGEGLNGAELNYDFWKKIYTDKGMNEVLDGNVYQAMLNACAQYAAYGGKDYPNATFEELLTWGNLGINFNQNEYDKFLFKVSDVKDDFMWFHYDAPFSVLVVSRGIDADTMAGTFLPKGLEILGASSDQIGCYIGAVPKEFWPNDNINFFCLPFLEHPHMIDGNVMDFKPWTSDDSLPTEAGNYYLTTDVTLNGVWGVPMDISEINLCLNGHVIKQTAEEERCISVGSRTTLNIHDCNGDNCTHEGYVDSSGLWHLGSGLSDVVDITGGVITGSNYGGVYVYAYGHFNMYGGTVAGNKANKYGGAVYNDGVFNMYGGDICYNTTSENSGGAIFVNSSYTSMYGGTISNNTAGYCGGGVHIANGKAFNMYGGTISKNKADYGAGICVYDGTLNMNGGTVSDNTATYGGGVYARSGSVVLGGSSVIDNNTDNNLYIKKGFLIDFGTGDNAPTKDMKISVTLDGGTGVFTNECADYSANFISDDAKYRVVYNSTSKALEIKNGNNLNPSQTEKGVDPALIQTVEKTDNSSTSPKTFDASNTALWFVLMGVAVMGIVICILSVKKKKDVK